MCQPSRDWGNCWTRRDLVSCPKVFLGSLPELISYSMYMIIENEQFNTCWFRNLGMHPFPNVTFCKMSWRMGFISRWFNSFKTTSSHLYINATARCLSFSGELSTWTFRHFQPNAELVIAAQALSYFHKCTLILNNFKLSAGNLLWIFLLSYWKPTSLVPWKFHQERKWFYD